MYACIIRTLAVHETMQRNISHFSLRLPSGCKLFNFSTEIPTFSPTTLNSAKNINKCVFAKRAGKTVACSSAVALHATMQRE